MEVATAVPLQQSQHRSKESGGGIELLATCVRNSPQLYPVMRVELFKSQLNQHEIARDESLFFKSAQCFPHDRDGRRWRKPGEEQLCLRQSTQSGIGSVASVAGNRNYTHFLRSRYSYRAGTISFGRIALSPLLLLCE